VILDIMLQGKDGLEILKEIQRDFDLPVMMLTAKGEDTDRIVGLGLGGNDYLAKPFNPRELLARIKAILRRVGSGIAGDPEAGLIRQIVAKLELRVGVFWGLMLAKRNNCPKFKNHFGISGVKG
jgi:two-component system, OmpR family, phosphate regulon response regulator OmpR